MASAVETENKKEAPRLEFNNYALAFHFAAESKGDQHAAPSKNDAKELAGRGAVGEPMESYERDLLLYAHRDEPPLRTRIVSVPASMSTLAARFPAELVYESELRRIRLHCKPGKTGRRRRFAVSTSVTLFKRSGIVVLNLVLQPLDDESPLNEYDLIKLIKLWEGGEGRSASCWGEEIRFETADGAATSLEKTADRLFQEWLRCRDAQADGGRQSRARLRRRRPELVPQAPPLTYRVGTVELQVPQIEWRDQLFRDIAALKEEGDAPNQKTQRTRWDRVAAVGGILQGLLDFRAITSDELADVFAEVDIDGEDESLVGFHKGTLLSLYAEPEAVSAEDERPSPIGVDPYLAIPNVVLLHNEQRLKVARQLELRLSLGQPGRSASQADRVDIDQTANGLDAITGLLAQHLPNIFHYRAERRLYETGGHSRGFDDLEKLIGLRRDELASTLQRRERLRDRWTAVLAIVFALVVGVVAAVQNLIVQEAIETLDWWVALIVAASLYLAYFQIRKRLF